MMPDISSFQNLDFFAVGIAIAATLILGFAIFFDNRKSATSRAFLFFAIMTAVYGAINYASYNVVGTAVILWLLRLTIFSAIWHAFSLFHLFYTFPDEEHRYSSAYKYGLFGAIFFTSLLTLTPFVFVKIAEIASPGAVSRAELGPGMALFAAVIVFLVFGGLSLLFHKTWRAEKKQKKQFFFVSAGTLITFALIITFNFVLPVVFENVQFIPWAPVFFFPFVVFTFYAISRHHLLNAKIVSTEILAFVLTVVALLEVVLSKDILVLIFRGAVFLLTLSFGILLIRSVRREVKQREELQELTEKLQSANTQLEELSHFKTQLLSIASHQIKSPIAAIKGFVSNLIEGLYGPVSDQVKGTLEKVKKSADELIQLINSLLDFRRVEEGKMDYQFAPVMLKDLVQNTVERLRPLASDKKLELTFVSASDASVNADGEKLTQVIQNLVDNAIKYTVSGFVKVELKEDGPYIVLSVSDSGYGIPANLIPHLFEEFVRDEKVKRQVRGTGLGLYIARKIVEAHGGALWAESEGEGKGSKFLFRIRKL